MANYPHNTETERERQRETERETARDSQRQPETARDRQRQTETDRDRHRQTQTDTDRQTNKQPRRRSCSINNPRARTSLTIRSRSIRSTLSVCTGWLQPRLLANPRNGRSRCFCWARSRSTCRRRSRACTPRQRRKTSRMERGVFISESVSYVAAKQPLLATVPSRTEELCPRGERRALTLGGRRERSEGRACMRTECW